MRIIWASFLQRGGFILPFLQRGRTTVHFPNDPIDYFVWYNKLSFAKDPHLLPTFVISGLPQVSHRGLQEHCRTTQGPWCQDQGLTNKKDQSRMLKDIQFSSVLFNKWVQLLVDFHGQLWPLSCFQHCSLQYLWSKFSTLILVFFFKEEWDSRSASGSFLVF